VHNPFIEIVGISLTPWTVIGLLGSLLFASRWIVQFFYSRSKGRSLTPPIFWHMSLAGSIITLIYFVFGSRDLVGILSNSFPAFIAGYNMYLLRKEKSSGQTTLDR
jgi:lipid-A-disaccharide synthase-like uncharacterized protein